MRKSRLSKPKQNRLMAYFVAGTTARCAAELVGVNRNTAAYYFHRLRIIISQKIDDQDIFEGEIEVDESYFGGRRKGKRGRGAGGKVPVFVSDVSEFKHYHINGIENFWSQAKRQLRKFNGIPEAHFNLFLKECEWRFNNPRPKLQLTQLRQWATENST